MTRGLAVLALLTLLAGCVSTGAPTVTKTNAAPLPLADPFHPAAARGGPATELSAPKALADVVVGQPGFAEPNVAPAFDGHTVYVGNPGSTWRSTDRGKSWTHPKNDGIEGGGDADIAVDANGTLYYLGLGGKEGRKVPLLTSRDGGDLWSKAVDLSAGSGV